MSNTNAITAYYSTANFFETNCMSKQFALVAEANQIAISDDLQFCKPGQSVQFFFF